MSNATVVMVAGLASFLIAAGGFAAGCGGSDSSVGGDGSDGGSADATAGDSGGSGDGSAGKDGAAGDSGTTCGTACTAFADGGAFPTFDDRADSVGNCASVKLHEVDSCGTVIAITFNHGFTDDFNNAEAAWRSSCGTGTGTPGPTLAQDGKTVPSDGGVAVQCINPDAGTCECETYVP